VNLTQTLQTIILATQVLLSLGFLFYASWSDHKAREVSNKVWLYFAPPALALTIINLAFFDLSQLPYFGLSFGLTAFLSLLLFYSGALGGADSKALMCIGLSLPFIPQALFKPVFANGVSPLSEVIFPLTIFGNAVLFAAASCIYMALRNVAWHKKTGQSLFPETLSKESVFKKILVIITGYKFTVSKLKEKWHIYPLEDIQQAEDGDFKRKLQVVPTEDGRDAIVGRLATAVENGKIDRYVWASPGLPLLIFVTLGLIVALVFGDVVWMLVRLVLG
jgi:archaeal preflagellin peptidase FlaK